MRRLRIYPIKDKNGKWIPFHEPTNQVLREVPFDTEEECKEWIKEFESKLSTAELKNAMMMRWEPISPIEGWKVVGTKKGGVLKGKQIKKTKSIQKEVEKAIYKKRGNQD